MTKNKPTTTTKNADINLGKFDNTEKNSKNSRIYK